MTVVYLDAFLALNFGVNYLLLACAGRLDGSPGAGGGWPWPPGWGQGMPP